MFQAFKNKWFIGFIVIGSIVGGIIGIIGSEMHARKIATAQRIQLVDYYNPDRLYISGIEDTLLKKEYLLFENDTVYPKALNFKSSAIKTTQKLYALDFTKDSSLVLVARENDNPTMADPRYTELWVWRNHVIIKK